jgi:hypothetical protein
MSKKPTILLKYYLRKLLDLNQIHFNYIANETSVFLTEGLVYVPHVRQRIISYLNNIIVA